MNKSFHSASYSYKNCFLTHPFILFIFATTVGNLAEIHILSYISKCRNLFQKVLTFYLDEMLGTNKLFAGNNVKLFVKIQIKVLPQNNKFCALIRCRIGINCDIIAGKHNCSRASYAWKKLVSGRLSVIICDGEKKKKWNHLLNYLTYEIISSHHYLPFNLYALKKDWQIFMLFQDSIGKTSLV